MSSAKEFKRMITKVITDNTNDPYIPDYSFELEGDLLIVRPLKATLDVNALPPLEPDTYEQARQFAQGWDIRALETEWRTWVRTKSIKIKNADANFISFCKKRGAYNNQESFI